MSSNFIQSLERRDLLAFTPTLTKGILYLRGTELSDAITIKLTGTTLSLSGSTALFPASKVKAIVIDARGGNDFVQLANPLTDPTASLINKQTLIHMGDGNDTVGGGFGRDLILGGGGNDELAGAWGNDVIVGGFGDDNIKGGDGNDMVYGSNGLDSVQGNAGNDYLMGNADADSVFGNEGDDTVAGGAGFDTLGGGTDRNVISDDFGGFLNSPDAGAIDRQVRQQVELIAGNLFGRFMKTRLEDLRAASHVIDPQNTTKSFRQLIGKYLYQGLYGNNRVAAFFGIRA